MTITHTKQKFTFPRPENISAFAEAVGVSRTAVYAWLNEDAVPTPAHREKIRAYFARLQG